MLNAKTKRSPLAGRATRFGDEAQDTDTTDWSGAAAATPPADLVDAAQDGTLTRVLRTQDDKPTAPKIKDLFPQETRSIERMVTFWDPGSVWPAQALADLNAEDGACRATRLVHAQTQRNFALIRHVCIEEPGGLCAVLHVEANPADPASADVALMLLERSHIAVVLSGGSAEHRDLPRRLQDFCRQAAWRGPTLQFVSPQDKPSRADRLRKISWPRNLRMQVLEWSTDTTPGWLARLMAAVHRQGGGHAAQAPAAEGHTETSDIAAAPTLPPRLPTPESLPQRPSTARCEQALQVAALAPALGAFAVVDGYAQTTLASHGDAHLLNAAVVEALHRWHVVASQPAAADASDAGEEQTQVWQGSSTGRVLLPVPHHPGLLLLGIVDPAHGDVAQARWQLGVARNEFA